MQRAAPGAQGVVGRHKVDVGKHLTKRRFRPRRITGVQPAFGQIAQRGEAERPLRLARLDFAQGAFGKDQRRAAPSLGDLEGAFLGQDKGPSLGILTAPARNRVST